MASISFGTKPMRLPVSIHTFDAIVCLRLAPITDASWHLDVDSVRPGGWRRPTQIVAWMPLGRRPTQHWPLKRGWCQRERPQHRGDRGARTKRGILLNSVPTTPEMAVGAHADREVQQGERAPRTREHPSPTRPPQRRGCHPAGAGRGGEKHRPPRLTQKRGEFPLKRVGQHINLVAVDGATESFWGSA